MPRRYDDDSSVDEDKSSRSRRVTRSTSRSRDEYPSRGVDQKNPRGREGEGSRSHRERRRDARSRSRSRSHSPGRRRSQGGSATGRCVGGGWGGILLGRGNKQDPGIAGAKGVGTDADVELENVLLAEDEEARERERRKKRAAAPVYTGVDDEEFHNGEMPSGKKLLAHYDEEEREKQAREKRKMVLTGPGERVEDGTEGGTEGGGEGGKEEPRKAISLGQERARTALADYLTPAEMEKFKKPKKMRKKSGRKKESDLVAELEATAEDVEEERRRRDEVLRKPKKRRGRPSSSSLAPSKWV
ncbi:hypothetical protein NSK_006300 [Nannochloropsis salina CCMP1776]|uniref:Uncharacterized protein n=1 Tax=Nannochloropsis salina CCMP1776 TaxID=1027361 RepID=A0A4D9D182_9STRA|nr:hypothetical protein NSK_006300 [Nannochloropsis salina CCMP1776]|eukprot:TFJ82389.1 hypothetical protein NSK_006300 [Nannochloropsis salina CCMP1776]